MATSSFDQSTVVTRIGKLNRHDTSPAEINIGDVLRLALPIDTTLLGGGVEARRFVNWVAILSSWDDFEVQIKPNDLVIIPQSLHATLTPNTAQSILSALAEYPVAGLLFIGDFGENLAQMAEALNLTVLVAPESATVRDIHQSLTLLLLDRQTATSERAIQLYRQLSAMSREGQGVAAMTEVMSKLTGNIVAVQDKRLEIQAISWPSNSTVSREAMIAALQQRDALPLSCSNT